MNELADRTLTIKRVFNAPLELVWEAWSQAEHIVQWWGPKGMKIEVLKHDFRVGGQWQYIMAMPDGSEFVADGTYSDIVVLEKIISSANFMPMTEGVEIQALFKARGDKTEFTFNCVHPTVEYCQQQEKMGFYNGWGSVFDRLAEHLQEKV